MVQTRSTTQSSGNTPEPPRGRAEPRAKAPQPSALDIPAALTVHDLATLMGVDPIEVIKNLMRNDYMLAINDVLEHETATLVAGSFGFRSNPLVEKEARPGSLVISPDEEDAEKLEARPPVVTILGHVDHGKTTLLDSIRESNVVASEAGGITQHIGAYQVTYESNPITFLDTPGHVAFTAMRARGAQITDIAILVVAADDGIMPQTIEAMDHVKAAGVPMVVAINKIDRPEADPERVKRQLAESDLLVEEWGGDVIAVPVSALKGEGISDLLENILVVAEVGDLKADPSRLAKGIVVEARMDKRKGPVSTVLVQTGTLKVGDNVVAGEVRGRVRAMLRENGKRTKEAGPSVPVEILGLSGLPLAGEAFVATADERSARELVESRQRERESRQARGDGITLEEIHTRLESGDVKALNLIVKTDVQGTVEAVRSSLESLNTEKARVNIIHIASGSISEGDVLLAVASQAIIVGFNRQPEPGARALANQEGIEVRFYDIIYKLIADVEKALEGLLAPTTRDVVEGYATVRAIFNLAREGKAAGIYVNNGRIGRGAEVHVLRNKKRLFAGPMLSLKHFKNDVRELNTDLEGGIVLEGFNDYREGDVLEAHVIEQVR